MAKVVGYDESKKHRATCRSCAAIIEYILNEVQEQHGTDWSGGADGHEFITCPGCSSKVILRSW